jgi:hypothetical protein
LGKVLKSVAVAAAIVGLAIVTGGVSLVPTFTAGSFVSITAAGAAMLTMAATTVLSGIAQQLFGPKAPRTQLSRLNVSLDPIAPRKAVFGTTAMNLDLRYHEASGTDQEYIDYIIAVAAHKVTAISEIWFEEKQAWTSSGGVTATYSGYLTVTTRTEGTSANTIAINGGAKWGSSRRLTGCAYLHLRIKRTGNTKKAESPLVNGLPSRVTVVGNGALLYDPRKDSTVTGGSGSHRANDQTTWGAYTDPDDCDNPALQLLWWLLGWKINGKLSIGCGVPANRIDMASFITAANLCDENVTLAIGGTQKRYRTSGTASDADNRMDIINTFLMSMNGTLRDNAGKLTLTVMNNDLANYVLDFNEADMLGEFDWQQTRGLTESYNIARGRYVDPSNNSLYQMVDYPEVSLTSPDGIERATTIDLAYVEDGRRAQRIAKQILQRNQYRGMFSATFNAKALGCQVGDVVRLSIEVMGWSNKLFRVISQEIRFDGQVPLALVEENAAIYSWVNEDVAPISPTAPTVYDPLNSPFILGIDDALVIAQNAQAEIDIISSDNWLSASEKPTLKVVYDALISNYTALDAKAASLGVASTERTNATSAINALNSFLGGLTPSWTDTAQDTPWTGTTANTRFDDAHEKVALLQAAVQGLPGADGADGTDGTDGQNAITGLLTNEAVTLSADSSGVVASFTPANGTFKVFNGTTDVTTSSAFTVASSSNCTVSIGGSTGIYSVSAMTADTASATFQAVYGGVTIQKILSLSKSRTGTAGAPGADGTDGTDGVNGNKFVPIFKRSATQPTTPTGNLTPSGWSTSIPAVNGQPAWRSDGEISGASTLVGSWTTPVLFEAVAPSPASQTILITAQTQTTAAITISLDNGESRSIDARVRVAGLSSSTTQNVVIQWREVGGTYAQLGSTGTDSGGAGDTIFAIALETLTNSSGIPKAYEVRAVASKTGGTGTIDQPSSYLKA